MIGAEKRQQKFIKNNPELTNLNIFEWLLVDQKEEKKLGYTPYRGNYESHQKIIKISKERNYKNVLIFEDDACPVYSWTETVNFLNNLKRPKKWDYIMLGCIPVKLTRTNNDNLYYVNCAYDAHAYIINVQSIKPTIYNENCRQIDYLFCNCMDQNDILGKVNLPDKLSVGIVFAFKPMLYIQDRNQDSLTYLDQTHFFNFYKDAFGNDTSMPISCFFNTVSFAISVIILLGLVLFFIGSCLINKKFDNKISIFLLSIVFLFLLGYIIGFLNNINNVIIIE